MQRRHSLMIPPTRVIHLYGQLTHPQMKQITVMIILAVIMIMTTITAAVITIMIMTAVIMMILPVVTLPAEMILPVVMITAAVTTTVMMIIPEKVISQMETQIPE